MPQPRVTFLPLGNFMLQAGMHRATLEVKRGCLKNTGAKFVPCFGLGEDAVAKSARGITTFRCVANLED